MEKNLSPTCYTFNKFSQAGKPHDEGLRKYDDNLDALLCQSILHTHGFLKPEGKQLFIHRTWYMVLNNLFHLAKLNNWSAFGFTGVSNKSQPTIFFNNSLAEVSILCCTGNVIKGVTGQTYLITKIERLFEEHFLSRYSRSYVLVSQYLNCNIRGCQVEYVSRNEKVSVGLALIISCNRCKNH